LSLAARRYASVLADVALERGNAEAVRAALAGFADAAADSAELRNFLANPAVPRESKQAVLEKIVARLGAGAELRNFLFLLVDQRRTELLAEIRASFEEELRARLGVAEAQVLSARELSAGEKAELTGALERVTGKKIEARYALDAGLIGGAVVRIGSTIYDGSVREQLERLRARLEAES
jgi:F-type H+-transporting ATPase subunit delta